MMKTPLCIVATLVLLSFCYVPAFAGFGDQLEKFTADDQTADDQFGQSVATRDNLAIVGAFADDHAGPYSGSAYLFDIIYGDQLEKFVADDAAPYDYFGESLAIGKIIPNGGNNIAIIGASGDDDAGERSGSVYVFDMATGDQVFKLTADDAAAYDYFGEFSIDISGDIAIIGATGNDDTVYGSGSAYLFDVITGKQLFKLNANDPTLTAGFGWSVAIDGNTAIIGALRGHNPGEDINDPNSGSGSAYIFDVTTGQQLAKLTAKDGMAEDHFGWDVDIDGNIAIVGAADDDDAGTSSGSAYLFDVTTGNQIAKLTADEAATRDYFGFSVAINKDTAIVGAYYADAVDNDSGAAYVFDTKSGDQIIKLTPDDGVENDWFGYSVDIDTKSIVGASFNPLSASTSTTITSSISVEDIPYNPGAAYSFNMMFDTGDFGIPIGLDAEDLQELYDARCLVDMRYDLNGDLTVDNLDVDIWVLSLYGTLYSDFDLDYNTNVLDFNIWFDNALNNHTNTTMLTGDANGDGFTNVLDFNVWWNNALNNPGPYAVAPSYVSHSIPEPASILLLGLGGIAVMRKRNKKYNLHKIAQT